MITVFVLVFVSFWTSWILDETVSRWGSRSPIPGHFYHIYVIGGATYYLSPWLAWYLDNSLWVHFAGLALLFLIPYFAGARWTRIR